MDNLFLDALSVKPAPKRHIIGPGVIHQPPRPASPVRSSSPLGTPSGHPTETHQRPSPQPSRRHPLADQIDAMVAEMVARGDVYLDGDTYTCRKRSWRMEVQS